MQDSCTSPFSLSPADRKALGQVANRAGGRCAVRACALLALADGATISAAARKSGATRLSVRLWAEQLRNGGLAAVTGPEAAFDTAFESLPPANPPTLLLNEAAGTSGRFPRARMRIECWLRNAVSLGLLQPGTPLPGRLWFERRFHAGAAAIGAALRVLADEGFLADGAPSTAAADKSRIATTPPHAGRFLLVLMGARMADGSLDGFCCRLCSATEAVSRSRGVSFDTVWNNPADLDNSAFNAAVRDVARQRYSGVFLRMACAQIPNRGGPGVFSSLPAVPMLTFHIHSKTLVSPLVRVIKPPATFVSRPDELCSEAARRGWRTVVIVDGPHDGCKQRAVAKGDILAAAAAHGLRVPPGGYCVVDPDAPDLAEDELERLFALPGAKRAAAVLIPCDNVVPLVAAALRRAFGATRASRFPVLVWSEGVAETPNGMRIIWRSFDLVRALSDFVDWCAEIHSGNYDATPANLLLK